MASLKAIGTAAAFLLTTIVQAAPAFDPRLGPPLEPRRRPTYGSADAPLVVIEVSSFQCPHCLEFRADTFPAIEKQYIKTGKVQWVVINAAPDADVAREPVFAIGKCLDRQNKYAPFADALYHNGNLPANQLLAGLRQQGGFDAAALTACLHDPALAAAIDADFADYRKLKVTGTPTFLLRKLRQGGRRSEARIVGNLPLSYFQRTIDTLLKLP